ncbi:hypothetical protein M407DRAFT_20442 [Tulasnella calospora MUT 4182]|uniref:C3H1-type domain-containing protein n=1 Tax=Tulasnella calospora MUT 4182 TaxID=1051891 RepID=A0A0C3QRS7_9AGAM|nr:hypothetical protein M407DRAFT_20442 [Tulasnella calospora MUT 4182]
MDPENVLANFVIRGPIDSKPALIVALFNLSTSLQNSDADIISLLDALTRQVGGLLEAVMTLRNDEAFTFRSRILKVVEKSSRSPHPTFVTCAERVGAYLISLPPWIALDSSVMQEYNALSARILSSKKPDGEDFIQKKEAPTMTSPPKPKKVAQPKSKKKRFVPLSLVSQDGPQEDTDKPLTSPVARKQPTSPDDTITRPSPIENFSKQLRTCLGVYFTACLENAVEELAVDNLLDTLVQKSMPSSTTRAALKAAAVKTRTSTTDTPHAQSSDTSLPESSNHLTLRLHNIAELLSYNTGSPVGEWPVVVSQEGIRQFQQYLRDNRGMFDRIEKAIRLDSTFADIRIQTIELVLTLFSQLSQGIFSLSNYYEIVSQRHGVPMHSANLGGGLRLVYQIDFGAPVDPWTESQFIRVFGVFPDSEANTEFWRAVSVLLALRGWEYIQSCVDQAESRRLAEGARSIGPSQLPPPDISECLSPGSEVNIAESHHPELHRILALEKYIPVNPSFFQAIQKFDDSSFMFAVSSVEDRIIKYPSSYLIMGRSGTGKTTCMIFRMIKLDIASKKAGKPLRQMFITHSRTLARRVRTYCAELMRTETNAPQGSARKSMLGPSLLDMDEGAEEEGVLPTKFSELDDSHFPLCLNFDQLCGLLEADFNLEFNASPLPKLKRLRKKGKNIVSRGPLVSFEYFKSHIWMHLDHRLKKGFHPALIYSEFMGIIKGSEATLSKPRRYLSRDEYESHSNQSLTGESTERSRIYSLFESYQKLRPPSAYDTADRVQVLIDSLQAKGIPGKSIDFLYIDEAQDNLIIDGALFRSLCSNPHGLSFAGDTAQTISVGSAFQFSELKSFLYRLERDDKSVKRGTRRAVDPHLFQLSINYRSHGGIVRAAGHIVLLLNSYFQQSIDKLPPEVSYLDVSFHKPKFFSSHRSQSEFSRLISTSSSGEVGLGAHQVIIVRDDEAATKLRDEISQAAIVLTLYESKGMEFDDVLLYNFFADSSATEANWRALFLAHQESRTFDVRRHAILQSELKSFYVGLTRAKRQVWIWDQSDEARAMETLLATLTLAESHGFDEAVPQFGVSNSVGEWAKQAQNYFSKNLFSEAGFCFRKAEMTWWADVALTYGKRQAALRLPEKNLERTSAFANVANEFDRLARQAQKMEYPENLRLMFLNAAESYAVVSDHVQAAKSFLRAQKFTEAAYHYRLAGLFEQAVKVVRHYPVDPAVAESIKYAAMVVFTRKQDLASLQKAWKLCENQEQFFEFLRDHGFEDQRIAFLDSISDHEEVAQALWENGDHMAAVHRFRMSSTPSSRRKASRCLSEGIAGNIFFSTSYGNPSSLASQLFELAKDTLLSTKDRTEITLFRAVATLNSAELKLHGQRCLAAQDFRGAFLALDAWTQSGAPSALEKADDQDAAELLSLCHKFSMAVKTVIRAHFDDPEFQGMFGIAATKSAGSSQPHEIVVQRVVLPHSFIYATALHSAGRSSTTASAGGDPVTLSRVAVDDILRHALLERLNGLLDTVDLLARKSRSFEFCKRFLTTGRCAREAELCWREHVQKDQLTLAKFNARFRLHLLIIALLDQFTAIHGHYDEEKSRAVKQRIWTERLFQVCYPLTNQCGNLSDITPALIPEFSLAMPIVKSWLQEIFRSLRPGKQTILFLKTLLITSLLATAFDYNEAVSYLWRGRWSEYPFIAARESLIHPSDNRPIAGSALAWFARKYEPRINVAVYFIEHILTNPVWLDVDVAMSYIEEVCAQLIISHCAHRRDAYDGLTLPRSWIIRAFVRAPSLRAGGNLPSQLVTALGKFLDILLLRPNSGTRTRLTVSGKEVERAPIAKVLNAAKGPGVGWNIPLEHNKMRKRVLAIFKAMVINPPPWSDFYGYATAQKWDDVVNSLKASGPSSSLDELITILQKEGAPINITGSRTVFCPDERKLLQRLQLTPHPPAITLQGEATQIDSTQNSAHEVKLGNKDTLTSRENNTRLESLAYVEEEWKSASVIQAFFRHRGRRAGGSLALTSVFEDLANRIVKASEPHPPERYILLCLRGPLPHVLAYLQTMMDVTQDAFKALNKEMLSSDHEALDELYMKRKEVQDARAALTQLVEELHPSSDFYFQGISNVAVSLVTIVEMVKTIPNLLTNIRKFCNCSENDDYDLGVEPLLSDRVPWGPKKPSLRLPVHRAWKKGRKVPAKKTL